MDCVACHRENTIMGFLNHKREMKDKNVDIGILKN